MGKYNKNMLCERCARHVDAPPDNLEPAVPAWTIKQYVYVMEHLREAREKCGLTQIEMASDVHAHQSHVVKWERWGTQPGIPNMRRIAAVLHREEYEPPPDPEGWTLERVLVELRAASADPRMFRALKVADQTVREWHRGAVPRLSVLLRVEAYCKGLEKAEA